jgi:hypothetical protein
MTEKFGRATGRIWRCETNFWTKSEIPLFAVAVAGAIGLSAANLAIQVNKERAAFDASASGHMLGQKAYPQQRGRPDARAHEPAGQLNF